MKIEYITTKLDNGKTLKHILQKKLYISNILLFNLVKFNKIYINGKNMSENVYLSSRMKNEEKITVLLDSKTDINKSNIKYSDKFKKYDFKLDILYEDEYILAVNKPAYMVSHPSASDYLTTLSNAAYSYLEAQGINTIHLITRLDKNTSGVCIFAKHKYVQELFARKKDTIDFKKEYIAIVNNIVKENHAIVEKNIIRAENSIILRKVCNAPLGDFAKTEYFKIKDNKDENYSVLKIILHTGRTHQIRVHMSSISHTLLGDDLYATNEEKNYISNKIKRQALHARSLTFYHPITGEYIEIIAPVPDDIKKLIDF